MNLRPLSTAPMLARGALLLVILTVATACHDDKRYSAVDRDTGVAPADAGDRPDIAEPDTALPDSTVDPRDTETVEDTGPLDVVEDVPTSCAGLNEPQCWTAPGCVLDQDVRDGRYFCRSAANFCESLGLEQCSSEAACESFYGNCYCPPDADCDCGGGPPPLCRLPETNRPCRMDWPTCTGGDQCCPAGASHGTCQRQCEPSHGGSSCGMLVKMEVTGGLCEYGGCYDAVQIHQGGYIIRELGGAAPTDGVLAPESFAAIETALQGVDVEGLQEGYGACCNAHFDGSDTYVTFATASGEPKTVRISDNSAPAELQALVELLWLDGATVEWLGRAASPVLAGVPFDEEGPVSTCENAEEMAAGWVDVRLFGPGGQVVSGAEVVLDGVAPHGDATLALQGQLELDAEGRIAVRTDDGHLWSIWLGAQGVPAPRLYPGELVTVHVRVQMAFAGWLVGIAIYGERGLLFAVDQGLSGLAATLPFDVTVTDVGCPPIDESGCSPRQAQGLRFVGEHQDFVLRTGEWGGLAALGYDVAVLNMQSFSTGYCDDYWHYAFAAYAIAGSDAGFCSLEPPPTVCEQAQQKLEDCYGYAGGQQYGLSWPACETDLDWCAAECMLPLSCGELDCEFDPDMDCDGWGPWYDCYRRCQEPAECASDAECVQTVDCCAQQYVCAPVDELIDTCDIDCDPTEIPPSCLCQQGQCQNVSVCQHGLDRFFECGYTIGDYAGGHDEDMLRALQAGTCDATTQCYANCLANPTEDVCFSCHFGPADCLRDPFGECTERCAP